MAESHAPYTGVRLESKRFEVGRRRRTGQERPAIGAGLVCRHVEQAWIKDAAYDN